MKKFFLLIILLCITGSGLFAQQTIKLIVNDTLRDVYKIELPVIKKMIDGKWTNYYNYNAKKGILQQFNGDNLIDYIAINPGKNIVKVFENNVWTDIFRLDAVGRTPYIQHLQDGKWTKFYMLDNLTIKKLVDNFWVTIGEVSDNKMDIFLLSAILYESHQ